MELEQAVQHRRDDTSTVTADRPRPRSGIGLAIAAFLGIAAAMVVAAVTNSPFAAVVVIGIAVLAALGSVLARD